MHLHISQSNTWKVLHICLYTNHSFYCFFLIILHKLMHYSKNKKKVLKRLCGGGRE